MEATNRRFDRGARSDLLLRADGEDVVMTTSRSAAQGLRLCVLVLLALMAAGCGSLGDWSKLPPPNQAAAFVQPTDPRIDTKDDAKLDALDAALTRRLAATGQSFSMLALSGGGANGAYGAGVLVGWTKAGGRPSFDLVTGVSTGALAAPFAFLGSEWDSRLEAAYLDGGAQALLHWRPWAVLVKPSVFDGTALRAIVNRNVTPELLAAIAAEHALGRRLLVVTTNLGTQEPVIWDMGALASQGDEAALTLFRDVLVASASIPGVFPPVVTPRLRADGVMINEMHVDGGVTAPFLVFPERLMDHDVDGDASAQGDIYLLINGQPQPRQHPVGGTFGSIMASTYDAWSKASTRAHIKANKAYADRFGLSLHIASIPLDEESSSLDFRPSTMQRLFQRGYADAVAAKAWGPSLGDAPAPAGEISAQ